MLACPSPPIEPMGVQESSSAHKASAQKNFESDSHVTTSSMVSGCLEPATQVAGLGNTLQKLRVSCVGSMT